MNRFRPIIIIAILALACTLIGYVLYRIGDSGSTSANAPGPDEKPTRQKNLDWLQRIEGIKEEDASTSTASTETKTTSTENGIGVAATSTTDLDPASTSTSDLDESAPSTTTKSKGRSRR